MFPYGSRRQVFQSKKSPLTRAFLRFKAQLTEFVFCLHKNYLLTVFFFSTKRNIGFVFDTVIIFNYCQHKNKTNETIQKKMFKVHFFVRGAEKAEPDTKVVIYFQLEIEGMRRDTAQSTRLKVPKRYWQNGCVSSRYHLSGHLNRHLAGIERSFSEIFDTLPVLYSGEAPSYERMRALYDPANNAPKKVKVFTFFEVLHEMMEAKIKKNEIKTETQKNYRTRIGNLKQFFDEKLLITEMKYRQIEALQAWMHAQTNKQGLPKFGLDHIAKHCTLIKQVIDYAVNREYLSHSPVARLNLSYAPMKPPKYLKADARKRIEAVTLESLTETRDIAVFLMHTGFSYTDYCSLESCHLVKTAGGRSFKKKRNKSAVYSLPPLLPEAEQIIEKYGGVECLPRPDLSDINKLLKILGDVAQVTEVTVGFRLSTSVFRETFASMMENEMMLENRTIMYMMGHTNPRQLNNYSSVMPERILHEMARN